MYDISVRYTVYFELLCIDNTSHQTNLNKSGINLHILLLDTPADGTIAQSPDQDQFMDAENNEDAQSGTNVGLTNDDNATISTPLLHDINPT